jgi:hypothetical protein
MGSNSAFKRPSIDFSRLYLIGPAFERSALHVRPVEDIDDPYAVARGEMDPPLSLRFQHSSGSTPRDLITTEYPPLRLLSARAIGVLRSSRAAGWHSHPVPVLGKERKPIEGYELLVVTGRSGAVDNARSVRISKMPPPGGNAYEVWKGFYFDEQSWDGNDLFCPGDSARIIVTDRIREAFAGEKLTNVTFTPLNEVERMESEL